MGDELKLLISRAQIAQTVARMARQISADYQTKNVVFIGVLKGAFVFLADLVRQLTIPAEIDFIRIASYGSEKESSGQVSVTKPVEIPLQGRDVLVVEDIVDTGLSLRFVMDYISAQKPSSLKTCTLLDKKSRREIGVQVDYVGFEIEDGFVVGYGLDCDERHRCLPEIFVLR